MGGRERRKEFERSLDRGSARPLSAKKRRSKVAASPWHKPAKFKIGDVARMLDCNVSTLRFYEHEGLVAPSRSTGGTRLYNEAEVARFSIAFRLNALGIPLRNIVALTLIRPGFVTGRDAAPRILSQLGELRATLTLRQAELDRIVIAIDRAEAMLVPCLVCPNMPTNTGCPTCLCSTQFEDSAMVALTWSVRD